MSNTLPHEPLPTVRETPALRTEGVLASRLGAYLVDLVIIAFWVLFLGFIVFFLGFLTFGLAWFLFALLVPGAGIIYSAITVGGDRQATLGMRLFGLKVVRVAGGRVDSLTAAVHALFFYVAAGTGLLLALDILVAFFNDERRMLHDLLIGLAVVKSDG